MFSCRGKSQAAGTELEERQPLQRPVAKNMRSALAPSGFRFSVRMLLPAVMPVADICWFSPASRRSSDAQSARAEMEKAQAQFRDFEKKDVKLRRSSNTASPSSELEDRIAKVRHCFKVAAAD